MKTYLTPKAITLETASYSLKMQGTPQINCGPGDSPCSGEPVGASCVDAFSVGQIFLPGTDTNSDPFCVIIVNGVEAGDCQTLFEAGPCEEGAEWVVECDATVGCQSDETDVIEVRCDGFQDATCELI
jgi:hypothetical protein